MIFTISIQHYKQQKAALISVTNALDLSEGNLAGVSGCSRDRVKSLELRLILLKGEMQL